MVSKHEWDWFCGCCQPVLLNCDGIFKNLFIVQSHFVLSKKTWSWKNEWCYQNGAVKNGKELFIFFIFIKYKLEQRLPLVYTKAKIGPIFAVCLILPGCPTDFWDRNFSISLSNFVQFLSDHESKISNETLYKSVDWKNRGKFLVHRFIEFHLKSLPQDQTKIAQNWTER